ncbi:Gfo/Idh/MocA family oxidoreductase [bacterium]|nr:Gfo/Idh/MocA family oxidoreductase [bacterium]
MKYFRVGILGCGKMGNVYARWFSRNPHCQITSFYNRTFSRAKELAGKYPGTQAKESWQEITDDPHVDIVGICTPSHEHLEQLESSVKSNKHVLCEKPMAGSLPESQRMYDIATETSVKVAIDFQMRFHPVIVKVDELLPRIGEIFHIDFVFGMYRPEITWRHKSIQGGGVLKELGSHLIDLSRHWVGEITAVSAQNQIISPLREVEDYSVSLFEFSNKATGYLSCNYYDRSSRNIIGNLIGSKGQINWQFSSYDPDDSRLRIYTDSGEEDVPIVIPEEVDLVYPGHLNSFGRAIDHFVDCILGDNEPLTGTAEGLRSMQITDASYRSARERKRIKLITQKR